MTETLSTAGLGGLWPKPAFRAYGEQALVHFNVAHQWRGDALQECRALFEGLNSLWSGFKAEKDLAASDNSAFRDMVLTALDEPSRHRFHTTPPVRSLVDFKPRIQNHDVLRRSPHYRPNAPIPTELARDAEECHRKLANAQSRLNTDPSTTHLEAWQKKVVELLYIVRSNLAHGEKTPYGPDRAKAERDRMVAAVVLPAVRTLIEELLGRPSLRLAAYGSLAPGKVNHSVVEPLGGKWVIGVIHGDLELSDDLPAFRWRPSGAPVVIQMLTSTSLTESWSRLDAFEGARYRRILVPVEHEGGVAVSYTYELNA